LVIEDAADVLVQLATGVSQFDSTADPAEQGVDMTLTCVKCHQYLRADDVRAVPDLTQFVSRR
jgi:hypothetical protein